jgi:hypothetical protein
MRWRLLILMVPLLSGGCQSPFPIVRMPQLRCYNRTIDDFVACKTARDVARQHMALLYAPTSFRPSYDFQAGFEQAYADVALGSDGQVPAMAPSPYWKSCQRTAEGHERAQDWLAGYSAGASHALESRGPFNQVIASGYPCSTPAPCQSPSTCE